MVSPTIFDHYIKIFINGKAALFAFLVLFLNFYFDKNAALMNMITGLSLAYLILYVGFKKIGHLENFSKKGDFSYGLYIWGFVIEQIVVLELPELNPYVHFAISATITLVLAALSWHFIEKRALTLKKKIKSRPYFLLPEDKSVFNKLNLLFRKNIKKS